MDGEDVFGRKISTRYARNVFQPAYSSDEGYGTATAAAPPPSRNAYAPPTNVRFIALFFLKPFVLIVLHLQCKLNTDRGQLCRLMSKLSNKVNDDFDGAVAAM